MAAVVHPFQTYEGSSNQPQVAKPGFVDAAAYGGGYGAGSGGGYPGQQQQTIDPRNRIETVRWATGLCACCDDCVPNLFMTWCCPCMSLAQICARMGLLSYKAALLRFMIMYVGGIVGRFFPGATARSARSSSYSSSSSSTTSQAAVLILAALLVIGQLAFRTQTVFARIQVRKRFQIPGNVCSDVCAACCCPCCAIAQMATHVKSYNPGDCSFAAPSTLPAYTL